MPTTSVLWALEEAAYTVLTGDSTLMSKVVGIYHQRPTLVTRPCITMEIQEVRDWSTQSTNGLEAELLVTVETDRRTAQTLHEILSRIHTLLHHASLSLSTGRLVMLFTDGMRLEQTLDNEPMKGEMVCVARVEV